MVQGDTVPEGDHSLNTVQKKGAAVSQASGGKIPCVNGIIVVEQLGSSTTDTPNMSGRLQEDGTHSQRIGKQTRQSWQVSSSESWPWYGASVRTGKFVTGCRSQGDSFQVGSKSSCWGAIFWMQHH